MRRESMFLEVKYNLRSDLLPAGGEVDSATED